MSQFGNQNDKHKSKKRLVLPASTDIDSTQHWKAPHFYDFELLVEML
jgi:hypothetical protein